MASDHVHRILNGLEQSHSQPLTLPAQLCAACVRALPVTGAGLSLMADSSVQGSVAATDGDAARIEDLQFALGEGPCWDACRLGRAVLHPDLASNAVRLWPAFGRAVLKTRIAAIFAFPLQVGGVQLGVLELYRDSAGELGPAEVSDALAYADAAVHLLLHLQNQMPLDELHPQLSGWIPNRWEIHRATGRIMAQTSVAAEEALLILRAKAFTDERPIIEAARDVMAGHLRFDERDGPTD